MENNSKNLAKIETALFQYGEPISVKKLSAILNLKKEDCEKLIEEYEESLKEKKRGLTLLKKEDKVQLSTKPELKEISEKIADEEFTEELTPASLETLTIIAYLGPIPKTTIDFIRGVNSSYTLRNLALRGLVERERSGHTYSYQVTFDFLKHLGVNSVENLPQYGEYKNILERYEIENRL